VGLLQNIVNFVRGTAPSPIKFNFGFRSTSKKQDYGRNPSPVRTPNVADFGGSRSTIPSFANGGAAFSSLPRKTQRVLGLDEKRLANYSVDQLMDILSDYHPDISFALWNFLRVGNSGFDIKVTKLNSDTRWEQAEKDINNLFNRMKLPNTSRFEKSRSIDKVINQLMMSLVTRGAASMEVVTTPDHKDVSFFAPVDPATIEFRYDNGRYIPYQDCQRIKLDIPTFFYEGLDERVDDPYGRSPILSAINMIFFQLQVLNDIKAVVHNQGYPRFDIKVLEEVLLNRVPISIRNNETAKAEWLNGKLNEIINMYNNLEPDDTFVHYDSVEIGSIGGKSGGGGALIDPEKLMGVIDNLIMSGLKTLSTILGRRSTGNTESFAKLEIKLYMRGVSALQDVVESIMARALTLYLNMIGKQGIVEFKFKPVEIRTELEQAQFEQIALQNYAYMRDQGWINQDEASQRAVGHAPAGEPDWEHLQKQTVDPTKNKDGGNKKGATDPAK
jgi:hypothetical protein